VPKGFPNKALAPLVRVPLLRKPLSAVMRAVNPFSSHDRFDRFANFLKVSNLRTQREVFQTVRAYYPLSTRFVVLPMDMAFMGYGKPRKNIHEQHRELEALAADPDFGQQVIPFAAVDPRHAGIVDTTKDLVNNHGFRGIKLYPPLGYNPNDPTLRLVYEFAQQAGIPVMTHCSKGGVRSKDMPKEDSTALTDPDQYKVVLRDFPELRLCLAHFGGDMEWKRYRDDPWDETSTEADKSWLGKIFDMVKSGDYPNLYTDISYTIFDFDKNVDILRVLMARDPALVERILFGSDFFMVEREKFSERTLSMSLRARLGEDLFQKIAETNPERYLGIT
jgi:predicted TIM-barrel fold metal-dependent hydrolase